MKIQKTALVVPLIVSFISFVIPVSFLHAAEGVSSDSLHDHKAQVFKVEGTVKVLKTSGSDWTPAQKGMILEAGDQILTSKSSHIEIAYDDHFLNIARIEENTKAEFKSIEPTDLRLEDGSIFSALDGLKGSGYQVSTPTAVAAVRGTHFDVSFDSATGKMDAAVIPDQKEHVSHLEIIPVKTEGAEPKSVMIEEGQQIKINQGTPETPKALDPARIEESHSKLNEMMKSVDPSMRQAGEEMMNPAMNQKNNSEKKEEPAGEKKDDDKNKALPPGGGNGGDNGGGGGPSQGGMKDSGMNLNRTMPDPVADKNMDAKMDAIVDTLIPRQDVPVDGAGKPEGMNPADSRKEDKNPAVMNQAPAGENRGEAVSGHHEAPRADFVQMMEFLQTGGAFDASAGGGDQPANINPTQLGVDMHGIFSNLGFDAKASDQMANTFQAIAGQIHPTEGMGGPTPFFAAPGGVGTAAGGMGAMGGGETGLMNLAGGGSGSGFSGHMGGFEGMMPGGSEGFHFDAASVTGDIARQVQETTQAGLPVDFHQYIPTEFENHLRAFTDFAYLNQLFGMLHTPDPIAGGHPQYLIEAIHTNGLDIPNGAGLPSLTQAPADSVLSGADIKLTITELKHIEGGVGDSTNHADDLAGVRYEIYHQDASMQKQIISQGNDVKCSTTGCQQAPPA